MDLNERKRPLVKDLNDHLVCLLCNGYLIDATTVIECLHSFCRGCIVKGLRSGPHACPVCKVMIVQPLLSDLNLQRIVYMMVPGLLKRETDRRRQFRVVNPQETPPPIGALELTLEDSISLSLEELDNESRNSLVNDTPMEDSRKVRYLKCPAAVTVRHLVRLLMLKRGWEQSNSEKGRIELLCRTHREASADHRLHVLNNGWTLLDLAYIFGWNRDAPMRLWYHVVTSTKSDSEVNNQNLIIKDGSALETIRPPTPPPSPKLNVPPVDNGQNTLPNSLKKPRCEVTPVMRSNPPESINNQDNCSKSSSRKSGKLDQPKKKKRRNKDQLFVEITKKPIHNLKMKLRLTPRPTMITTNKDDSSDSSSNLLIKREKVRNKVNSDNSTKVEGKIKDKKREETTTIDDIIDEIPDEIFKLVDNSPAPEVQQSPQKSAKSSATIVSPPKPSAPSSTAISLIDTATKKPEEAKVDTEPDDSPKNEELLRRLGLVAVKEAERSLKKKAEEDQVNDREKLEKQLRDGKANRVRSLLAEKNLRDALKSMAKPKSINESDTTTTTTNPPALSEQGLSKKKKGPPPPLTPITPRGNKPVITSNEKVTNGQILFKYETPLDLSSNPGPGAFNIRTLTHTVSSHQNNAPSSNKVALRIPQPHNRIAGFNLRAIKPNLGVRHIPNPQAVVVSQYRNQRSSFLQPDKLS